MKNNSYPSNKLNFCLKSKINKDYLKYENALNYEGYEGYEGYEELWYCSYCDKEFDIKYMCKKHEDYCKKRPCSICYNLGHREINCI
tara:strand:+ start:1372 stop:1632 length:261 start_codon:yes stop_codon:yes gene_type:complete